MKSVLTEVSEINVSVSDLNTPLVSIICLTFNHLKYVRQAVESFLVQVTDFDYEIVIHDDASSDGTTEILNQYAKKFPSKIRLITQQENQYSKFGFAKVLKTVIDNSRGNFLAFCEGDDHWISEYKLQIQVNALLKAGVDMAFHPAAELRGEDLIYPDISRYEEKIYSASELIRKDFHFIQTSSLIISKASLKKEDYEIMSRCPVADVILRFAAARENGAVCINFVGSVYRVLSEGSWSSSVNSAKKQFNFTLAMLNSIDELNNQSGRVYSAEFEYYKRNFVKNFLALRCSSLAMKFDLVGKLAFKHRIYCFLYMFLISLKKV
jgi:glycosyltransferase involved in cell wall biosynthesis